MAGWHDDFKQFFNYLIIFAFAILFWNGFKADMAKRDGTRNVAQVKSSSVRMVNQQPTYRKVYVNNNYGGPATVYYIRN